MKLIRISPATNAVYHRESHPGTSVCGVSLSRPWHKLRGTTRRVCKRCEMKFQREATEPCQNKERV